MEMFHISIIWMLSQLRARSKPFLPIKFQRHEGKYECGGLWWQKLITT